MSYNIDRIVAGIMEEEPSTFSKISNFIFGRGPLKQAAEFGSGSAGTPSTTNTGSGFKPVSGMGGKSLADLAQDQASRQGIGKTSTVVHKSSSSTSAPPLSGKSTSAPPAVKPVSSAPKMSKPLTQSMEKVRMLVQAVAEGADPRDVLHVAPRIMEAAPPRQEIDPDYSVGRGSRVALLELVMLLALSET